MNRIDPTGKLFGTICAIIAVGAVVGAAMGAFSAATTAISCAIPKFGTPNNDAVDAFATALLWGEGSALVTALDVAAHKMFDHFRSKLDSLLEQLWNDDSGEIVCRGVLR